MSNINRSWKESALKSLDYLLLEFEEGVVPIQVLNSYVSIYKPYFVGTLQPAGSPGSATSTQFSPLINGSDLLSIPTQYQALIYQIFVGINPASVDMWELSPANTTYKGNLYNINEIDPNTNPYGYIRGYDTPYEEPTEISELFSVYAMKSAFMLRNEDPDNVVDIRMSFYINIIIPRILREDKPEDKPIIDEMVNTMTVNGKPVKFYQLGFVYMYKYPSQLATVWNTKPIKTDFLLKSTSLSGE
jgi:hypothetical protein